MPSEQLKLYVKDIVEIIKGRRDNKFDTRMAFGGDTGDGKSTCAYKILFRFKEFSPWKHVVYDRTAVINLLRTQHNGYCLDDEAIKSSYKRRFQSGEQQDLVEILTAYRDNFNVYCAIMPNFFNFDKAIRDLFAFFIQVIERGVAVVHRPLKGVVFNQDKWDALNNAKIERSWIEQRKKNPNFSPPYHTLSTFVGYLFFEDLTPGQRELVEEVKRVKRAKSFGEDEQTEEATFTKRVYEKLIDGKLTKEGLMQICQVEGKKYSSITAIMNRMLKDNGETKTLSDFFQVTEEKATQESQAEVLKHLNG